MLALSRTTLLITHPLARTFTCAPTLAKHLQLPPRRQVNESELVEKFLKGSGPGGQKINKTSSAVQLRHLPTGTVVKCQATRSLTQNRKIARQLLAEKLDVDENGEESRKKLKEASANKKKASASKKSRRKYRALEEEKKKREAGEVGEVLYEAAEVRDLTVEAADDGKTELGKS